MTDSLVTRPSLLIRIRDLRDDEAWRQFVRLYAPLVFRFARRKGLQEADAADLVQDVLQQAATAANRFDYDRERGSFRSWLFRVCTNRFNTLQRGQRKPGGGSGDSGVQGWLDQQPAPEGEASAWERDCEKQLFDAAARQVRSEFAPSSWAAFVQTSVEGRPAHDVAAELGISVGAVYVAKSRIVARLREKIKELDE